MDGVACALDRAGGVDLNRGSRSRNRSRSSTALFPIAWPNRALVRIFCMFMQIDSSFGRAQGGLGIGLTLIKQLVELHGRTAEVNSAVADNAQAITPEFMPHLLDRFQQPVGSSTRRHCGPGLGLMISRQLVQLQQGSIRPAAPAEIRAPLSPWLCWRRARKANPTLLAAGLQRHRDKQASAQSLLQALPELRAARKDWCTFAVGGD